MPLRGPREGKQGRGGREGKYWPGLAHIAKVFVEVFVGLSWVSGRSRKLPWSDYEALVLMLCHVFVGGCLSYLCLFILCSTYNIN